MKNNTLTLLTVLAASASTTLASVSFNLDADHLKDNLGNSLKEGALVMLVASTTDTTFSPLSAGSISTNSFLGTSDDLVLWRGFVTDTGATYSYPILNAQVPAMEFANGWGQDDRLALLWFPTLTESSTSIDVGTVYGLYTNPSSTTLSSAWITPANGTSNYLLGLYTIDGAQVLGEPGEIASDAGMASFTVSAIPEPSTYAAIFGALTLGGVCYRRYRRK
jgi:hypothetical protein